MAFFKSIVDLFTSDELQELEIIDLTYVWKVENYTSIPLSESKVSQKFEVGEVWYSLELLKDGYLNVKLIQIKPQEPALKYLFSVGIVDQYGKLRHFVQREAEIGKGSEVKGLLKISEDVIMKEKNNLIPKDILSIHLTINLQRENNLLILYNSAHGLKSLSSSLGKLFEDETDSDVVLKVGDAKFKAHRAVLSARSPTFNQMFCQNSKERSRGTIDITDVESSTFGDVLRYIYTGKVRGLTSDTASEWIRVSDKYRLYELKNISIGFLAANLTTENICGAILATEKFPDEQLEKATFEFLCENADGIIKSDQWNNFKGEYTAIANSVLSRIILSAKTK